VLQKHLRNLRQIDPAIAGGGFGALESIALPCSINIGRVNGGLTNRTTATSIAGMRSKTNTGIKTPFQRRKKPREATPFTRFTRTRRFFAFGVGICPKRPRRRPERNPLPNEPSFAEIVRLTLSISQG
jgi:hypothetical protein